ncbi:Heterokaryon incompatibility protein [Lasiodiplodia theobromae]|uniref:Heterokaryon incompatibility protein n=1 Tax=Lasiodiplodia theobromae TaxID=45133 RepID=UPI0015C35E62|nr:Heterokaryon incompatibility protein [Lasiodiplodia theobromae]KAF4545881.1 Heterokaryon incompatibility protein [Lasiodiplodia theobromae]
MIGMAFDETGVMLFKNEEYVGDLLLDPETAPTPPDCGKIQWDLIKGWLAEHPKQPTTQGTWPGKIFDDFRLIDVVRNCVVRVSEPHDYATLSYVWGASTEVQLEARKRTIAILEQEGSLLSADVPTTIYDAIVATKMLGLRYLWVDRICIVQDDENNKLHQISQMDRIYATSYVTLVAALGRDAMSGLPGVRVDRREVKYSVHWNGLTVAFPYRPDIGGLGATSRSASLRKPKPWRWLMRDSDSKWYNRGWTYQEAVVSERLLYFTEEGAFLEIKGNSVLLAEGDTRVSQRKKARRSSPSYYDAVWEILHRKFTHSTDVLLAFQGVLNWVIEKDCYIDKNHRFGIPFEEFDEAIQWKTGNTSHKRSPASPQKFPSWSWASMENFVDYGETVMTCGSLATWAFCEPAANDQLCLVPVMSRPKRYCDSWGVQKGLDVRVLMMIAWLQGCFARPPLFHFTPDSSLSSIQRQIDEQFPTYDDFWRISRGENWQQEMFSQQDLKTASIQPGRVLVHTQCALLQLQGVEGSTSYFHIRRPNGQWIGLVELSQESQEILSSIGIQDAEICVEFLALGIYFGVDFTFARADGLKKTSSGTWEPGDPDFENNEAFSKEMNHVCAMESASDFELERESPPQVVVMLIHRCGPVARRLGLGHVYLKLWGETEKELKTVVLE